MFIGIEFHRVSTDDWINPKAVSDWADCDGLRLLDLHPDGVHYLTVMYADIPGNSWNQNRLNKFMERANQLLQKRTPLTSLPVDDPDRLADPNKPPWFYWDGGDLVEVWNMVVDATWDGQRLIIGIRSRPMAL